MNKYNGTINNINVILYYLFIILCSPSLVEILKWRPASNVHVMYVCMYGYDYHWTRHLIAFCQHSANSCSWVHIPERNPKRSGGIIKGIDKDDNRNGNVIRTMITTMSYPTPSLPSLWL